MPVRIRFEKPCGNRVLERTATSTMRWAPVLFDGLFSSESNIPKIKVWTAKSTTQTRVKGVGYWFCFFFYAKFFFRSSWYTYRVHPAYIRIRLKKNYSLRFSLGYTYNNNNNNNTLQYFIREHVFEAHIIIKHAMYCCAGRKRKSRDNGIVYSVIYDERK
jgi:hypothetical protein